MERFLNNLEDSLAEEQGFSTVGVALALLLSFALIFSAARVYEIESVSGDIQNVADSAALAAENVVGEYCVIATMCDAVVLSLSLSSLCALGLSVAAACTPPTAALSQALLKSAQKLKQVRDSFSEKATSALEELKLMLPLVAAAKAANVIAENANARNGVAYRGVAILIPWQTEPLEEHATTKTDEAFSAVDQKRDELEQLGAEAEEAAHEANRIKEEAYRYDCGSETNYCMYERAKNLAHLSGSENPYYSSSETWDFGVALARAQAYYHARVGQEAPANDSVAEQARSALRKRFYHFAAIELARGYVNNSGEGFDAFLPILPRNTEEMRETELYSEEVYKINLVETGASGGGSTGSNIQKDGMFKLHAYDTCPDLLRSHSRLGYGSLKDIEDDPVRFRICPECQLSPQSMGSVAAASTSIPNGFEYHYRKVAELAREYAEQREELDERSKKLKEEANGLFDSITEALDEAKTARIKIDPPGKYGAIAFVTTTDPGHTNFLSGFVSGSSSFSKRAAIAGATLLPESTESGKTAINSILDDYASTNAGALVGAERIVLDLWSGLLKGYGEGQDALSNGLKSAIDSLPLASESGLGQWAADLFESSLSALGLEPVDLSPQKATLINTAHIMSQDDSNFSLRLLSIKEEVLSAADTDSLFTDALSSAESSITDAIGSAEFTIQVATIKIIEGKVEIPITITLPQSIKDAATGAVQENFSALKNAIESTSPYRRWE